MRPLYLTILLLCCFCTSQAGIAKLQPTVLSKDADGNWTYEKVIEVPGASKEQLYDRLRSWVIKTVKSSDNNALTDDPKRQTLVTTPTIALEDLKYNDITGQTLNFKLIIEVKDGKIKVTATSFNYFGLQAGSSGKYAVKGTLEDYKNYSKYINEANGKIDESFTKFSESLIRASKSEAKNDW